MRGPSDDGDAEKDNSHGREFPPAKRFAIEQPAEKYRDNRIHIVISRHHCNRQMLKRIDESAVTDDRAECHQVQQGPRAVRIPPQGMLLHSKRRQHEE